MDRQYDALLLVSFGGPEGMEDVVPFLENVLKGKNVPRERMLEVAGHYEAFDGVSPINQQNRDLIAALEGEFERRGIDLPIYWGNRNWKPFLSEAIQRMADDGIRRALAFFTSAYSSYSGCRQYRENIQDARKRVGEGAPAIEKLRVFFNHPGFIQANAERVREAFVKIPEPRRDQTVLLFTAHSIPVAMAENCRYEEQLLEACRLVGEALRHPLWRLAYQSRSGPPWQPWLEPDVREALGEVKSEGARDVILAPIGFTSDHLEVAYDLDTEAAEHCVELGLDMQRAGSAGTHPAFVAMVRELVEEKISGAPARACGPFGLSPGQCSRDCCRYEPRRPPMAASDRSRAEA